ncbi:MAG TPA: glycosyltransferase family 4 protein [Bacteroidales bacterium]|nr:glycosyltransferase family 4 protein [Bacteroidales bacterium]
MKILMFGWEFPPHITGGLGTACYGLTQSLAGEGAEIIFVAPKAYGDEDQSAVRLMGASDIEIDASDPDTIEFWKRVTYLEIGSNLIPYVTPEAFRRIVEEQQQQKESTEDLVLKTKFIFNGGYGADLLAEVSRYALIAAGLAGKQQFDVIHAHDWPTYPAGITAATISGKPLIVHVHATEFDRSGPNINKEVYDIERRGMIAADRVIAVSNYTRNTIIEKYGIAPEKVVTVHNGIAAATNYTGNKTRHLKEKIVTFLGRLTQQKGPEYFIEAAHLLLQHSDNVRFVMAGSGDMLPKLVRQVARLGIGTRFHFTGFLDEQEVQQLFAVSDVFVMPSVSEPFGLVPLEAIRANVPVVISRQSGVSEVLDHVLKVDFWDVDALADAIHGLLSYNSLANEFKKHGKNEVNQLNWDNAAREVMKVYEDVVAVSQLT